ncbi:DUF397 domain-containing protein [Kineosporia mesophila]|uniref:DUF397 domain-containing protein n=1 Tax=Kineosporia mesophila TaxID=566012 RepID=A0ABP6Z4W0_9ACTN|nr:DUF397 domain-containing protein [Kineosporia mesophila]MCD5355007.1 DUF397 domain-containing protein [Kineosporia mesophila]
MMGDTEWIKASASQASGDCVEMRRHDGLIQVRDSKDPDGPILSFPRSPMAAWLDAAGNGEFDVLR